MHPFLGVLPCESCKLSKQLKLPQPIEFTSDDIKWGRKEYKDHIIQPFRGDDVSKEYLDTYGTKGIKVTPEEVKKAKYVWDETKYYKE